MRLATTSAHLSVPERARLLPVLHQARFLRGLDPTAADALLQHSRLSLLGSGGALWHEGDPAHDLAVIATGRLKLVRLAHAVETILDVAVAGDVLGEEAFALGASYQSDVVALRRSEALLVPSSQVHALLETHAASGEALAQDLAAQLIRLYRVAEDLGPSDVEQRLARVFLRLAERLGEPFPGGTYLGIRLRRRDLAAMAATTLESVSRHLSDWQRERLLTAQPAGFLLHDLEALERRAEKPSEPDRHKPGHG